jgi:hypothetical protein
MNSSREARLLRNVIFDASHWFWEKKLTLFPPADGE